MLAPLIVYTIRKAMISNAEMRKANPLRFCSSTKELNNIPDNRHYRRMTSSVDYRHCNFCDEYGKTINIDDFIIVIAGDNFHNMTDIKEGYMLFISRGFNPASRKNDERFYIATTTSPDNPFLYQIRKCWRVMELDFSDKNKAIEDITEEIKLISSYDEKFKKVKTLYGFNYMDMMMDVSVKLEDFYHHLDDIDELRKVRICLTTGCSDDENIYRWFFYTVDEIVGDCKYMFNMRNDD